jgi:hypothetical protein
MRIGDARDDRDGLLHMIVSRARVETDNRKNASQPMPSTALTMSVALTAKQRASAKRRAGTAASGLSRNHAARFTAL